MEDDRCEIMRDSFPLKKFRCSIVLPTIETRSEEEMHPLAFSIIAHRDARSLKSWQIRMSGC